MDAKITYRMDYQLPSFLCDRVTLHFILDPEETLVSNEMQLRRLSADSPLKLDGEALELVEVKLNGEILPASEYFLENQQLIFPAMPDKFQLTIVTRINPKKNEELSGLYCSGSILCTQCEAEGFRRITYYLDRPDVMAIFTTHIKAKKTVYPVLLANGNLISSGDLEDDYHFASWADPFPKPCYLFALVAGPLESLSDTFITQSKRIVTLQIYASSAQIHQGQFALQALKKAMRWDEEEYGREYDLDIFMLVAIDDFNMGAMENKGLNIFNSRYILVDPASATDRDYANVEAIVAHEYFHNWTGNRITCRDWFQLSLKEGLTVFREQSFCESVGLGVVRRLESIRLLVEQQFAQDSGPLAHPIRPDAYMEIDNFYTVTVYEKGAEIIRLLKTLLGEEGFQKGMTQYFNTCDGKAVTCDDFVQAHAIANHTDLSQFMLWYSQAGTPEVVFETRYDSAQKRYYLNARQFCSITPGQNKKEPVCISIKIALWNEQGTATPLALSLDEINSPQERTLLLQTVSEEFVFFKVDSKPIPSFLRGFSSPVKVHYDYSRTDACFLLAHETDAYQRWSLVQKIASDDLLSQLDAEVVVVEKHYQRAIEKLVTDPSLEAGLKALLLTVPSEMYLGEQCQPIDVEKIHRTRERYSDALSCLHLDHYLKDYRALQTQGKYQFDSDSIGKRSLKNLYLQAIFRADKNRGLDLAFSQFKNSQNMTDTMGALNALNLTNSEQRKDALAIFYQKWKTDPLVLDKWFSLQVLTDFSDTIEHVTTLLKHPAFVWTNPNRVRAVLGVFSQQNRVVFHKNTGEGYELLTDAILFLSNKNPQLAARLVDPFIAWRKYESLAAHKMKSILETILASQKSLSKDVYEVCYKALKEAPC